VHGAVDDSTRLAYAEVLADEQGMTAHGFVARPGLVRRAEHHRHARLQRQRQLFPPPAHRAAVAAHARSHARRPVMAPPPA
jgi:hypothetical protein